MREALVKASADCAASPHSSQHYSKVRPAHICCQGRDVSAWRW